MTTNVRALAALGLAVGLLGTAGAGVYLAAAPAAPAAVQEPKQDSEPAGARKADPPPKAPATVAAPKAGGKGTATALDEKFGVVLDGVTQFRELLDRVEDQTDLIVRVDVAAFRRLEGLNGEEGGFNVEQFLESIYETRVILPRRADRLPTRDILADALAQVRPPFQVPCTYQVRGNQLVIVPAYRPPVRPGTNPLALSDDDTDSPTLPVNLVHEQIYGGVVAVTADKKPLADILADLRKQTGANIVLDPRAEAVAGKSALTVSLSDVRLYDALRVIADMAELQLVYAGNIYYVTTPANARTFQPPPPRPTAPIPVPTP